MTQVKFNGKCHNCGKQGHKAAECQSGGKKPRSNQKTTIPADQSKTIKAPKKKINSLILEYVECIKFSLKCFGQRAIFWGEFKQCAANLLKAIGQG